jgi:hypothetical protein
MNQNITKQIGTSSTNLLTTMMMSALAAISACSFGEPEVPSEQTNTIESALSCGGLASGESLARGQSIKSCNGKATLVHQTDGNVVLYDQVGAAWSTKTAVRSNTTSFIMQTDGNLVLYTTTGAIWASGTNGRPGARLALQDDCNLVIYDTAGRAIWTTSTFCRTPTTTIDLFSYVAPGCGAAGLQYSAQAGIRWYVPMGKDSSGRKQFAYVKNHSGTDYESYTADEQWIRLWKDTSWAYFENGTYCDEQCGALKQPTSCKHQWRGDPVPGGYAYQAPKDTSDWGGAKVLPRYFNPALGTQTFTFNIYVDAQSESTCGACDSWHEGYTSQTYTVQRLSSVTAPNGTVYNDVIKKVIIDGAGKDEVYYFAYGKGWVGYELLNTTYKDWVTGLTSGALYPATCSSGGAVSNC